MKSFVSGVRFLPDSQIYRYSCSIFEFKFLISILSLFIISAMKGSLAKAIVSMSQLSFNKKIKEAEINPLIIKNDGKGVIAVDGLIVLKTDN